MVSSPERWKRGRRALGEIEGERGTYWHKKKKKGKEKKGKGKRASASVDV